MIQPPRRFHPRSSLPKVTAAALGLALATTGCGAGGAPTSAPAITIVTGNSALAEIASEIGASHVKVVDVVPDGANPHTAALDAAATAQVRAAGVDLLVGGGYQPALEAAAAGASHVVALSPTYGSPTDGPWLVPGVIAKLAPVLAAAMTAANPAAKATYVNGAEDVVAEMSSLSADFQNSLSDCTRKAIVTPDTEWAAMSHRYGLTDRAIGTSPSPDPTTVRAAAGVVRAAGATTLFSEPWVADATVRAAAGSTGTKVEALDTLDGIPAGGWPVGATYSRLMENDLTVLTSALQCAQMGAT